MQQHMSCFPYFSYWGFEEFTWYMYIFLEFEPISLHTIDESTIQIFKIITWPSLMKCHFQHVCWDQVVLHTPDLWLTACVISPKLWVCGNSLTISHLHFGYVFCYTTSHSHHHSVHQWGTRKLGINVRFHSPSIICILFMRNLLCLYTSCNLITSSSRH
jgi:hypothetical protein